MKPPTTRFDHIGFNAILSILLPIDMHIGLNLCQKRAWIALLKPGDIVDKLQCTDHLDPMLQRDNGPIGSLIALDRGVGIERYDEPIGLTRRFEEDKEVPRMEQVKRAVDRHKRVVSGSELSDLFS